MSPYVFPIEPLRCAVPPHPGKLTRKDLFEFWHSVRKDIERRLDDFRTVGYEADDYALFCELAFCLFTPQSKAVSCWSAVTSLSDSRLVISGTRDSIADTVRRRVRFHRNKSAFFVEARNMLLSGKRGCFRDKLAGFPSSRSAREWLVENIRGLGYKEGSHFLRNIGRGRNIAILDRHILRNLLDLGVIKDVPSTLTQRNYLAIEDAMASFSRSAGIPMNHLDLLFWCHETGEIFK